jgi:hypothetical protein
VSFGSEQGPLEERTSLHHYELLVFLFCVRKGGMVADPSVDLDFTGVACRPKKQTCQGTSISSFVVVEGESGCIHLD